MAYMSQERKKTIAEELKKVLAGTGIKYSLGVRHHSTLVMKIKSGPVDFIQNYNETLIADHVELRCPHWKPAAGYLDVNEYHYKSQFTGTALNLMSSILKVMNTGNHDNSDIQTDYFDVGWYVDVKIGNWEQPYQINRQN